MQAEYERFMATSPSLEEFELQLKRIMDVEQVGWGEGMNREWWGHSGAPGIEAIGRWWTSTAQAAAACGAASCRGCAC